MNYMHYVRKKKIFQGGRKKEDAYSRFTYELKSNIETDLNWNEKKTKCTGAF